MRNVRGKKIRENLPALMSYELFCFPGAEHNRYAIPTAYTLREKTERVKIQGKLC